MDRSFTVIASGTGSYDGTVQGTIRVEVRQTPVSGTMTYNSITIEFGSTGTQSPQWTGAKTGQTLSYSIAPSVSGVSINSATGQVSVSANAGIMVQNFTVTASGTGKF